VDILERINSAAFARNPRYRRGAEVKLHKDYPSSLPSCDVRPGSLTVPESCENNF
jgi:hypothetical protein